MQTITFYSYKGGVGRTLAVANVAKYLSRFGQRVFAIDLDLEAPGLHYKLMLGQTSPTLNINRGLVDYIDGVTTEGEVQGELADYVVKIEERQASGGLIHMMPAGRVPSAAYWRKLARINWHDLFYAEDAKGVPLFLDLKTRIEKEYEPDVILIDARTGITEMGGVATTLLADTVVCLMMHNIENLEGARAVLRSIKRAPRLPRQKSVEVIPVLTRIPKYRRSDVEDRLLVSTRSFLNEQAEDIADTLNLPDIFILHSETDLEVAEELRIGGAKGFDESPLLRDYLRLFSQLIAREKVEPQLSKFVSTALDRALDDPAGTQRELEALSASYPHAETYRALLKFYRLRRMGDDLLLATASRLWELGRQAEDPLLWEISREHFKKAPSAGAPQVFSGEFLEAAWRAAGAADNAFAVKLAEFWAQGGDARRAAHVLKTATEVNPEGPVAVAYIKAIRLQENWTEAAALIERYRAFEDAPGFLTEWAHVILARQDRADALRFIEGDAQSGVRLTKLLSQDQQLGVRLLYLAERSEAADSFLDSALNRAIEKESPPELAELALLFDELNRSREFELKVGAATGPRKLAEIKKAADEMRGMRRFSGRRARLTF